MRLSPCTNTRAAVEVFLCDLRKRAETHDVVSLGALLLALAVLVGPADIGRHSERRDWLSVRHVAQLGGFPEIADNGVLIDASRHAVSFVC